MEIDDLTALLSNLTLSTPAVRFSDLPCQDCLKLTIPQKPVPKPPNALHRIPPEIRAIIFKYSLVVREIPKMLVFCYARVPVAPIAPLAPAAQTPSVPIYKPRESAMLTTSNLLAALRTTPDLYGEALEVFYAINRFILDITTFRSFIQLRIEAVRLIKCIRVDVR
jgi:hypothetical protein